MAQQWFYTKDGTSKIGPISSADLRSLAISGQLLPTDMVWKEGMGQWTTASRIKALFANPESAPKACPPPAPIPLNSPQLAHATPTPTDLSSAGGSNLPVKATAPSHGRGASTKIVLIAGGALLGLILLIVIVSGWISGGSGGSKSKALEVTISELEKEYEANRLAADEKYKGKTLQFTGAVRSIGQDNSGNAKIDVGGFPRYVRCLFDDKHKSELTKLSRGQTVTVRGILIGEWPLDFPTIEKCEMTEVKPISLELTASDLYTEYNDANSGADLKYHGKTVKITGKVKRIGRESIALECGAEHAALDCKFDDDHKGECANIPEGKSITIQGICNCDGDIGRVSIRNCKLAK